MNKFVLCYLGPSSEKFRVCSSLSEAVQLGSKHVESSCAPTGFAVLIDSLDPNDEDVNTDAE